MWGHPRDLETISDGRHNFSICADLKKVLSTSADRMSLGSLWTSLDHLGIRASASLHYIALSDPVAIVEPDARSREG